MVSVIITTFGGGEKLSRAINSVLHQTYKKYEIIVVDDNNSNTDERKQTERVMSNFLDYRNISYIKHSKNKNGAAARNTGIFYAKGEYICFLDDDDVYLPERLEKSVKFLERYKDVVGVCTKVILMEKGNIYELFNPKKKILELEDILERQSSIGTGSNIFLRKKVVLEVNGFNEKFERFQDLEFMIRILQKGKVEFINDFEIIKDTNGVRTLNYDAMKNAFYEFDNSFKDLILKLDEHKRKLYYLDRAKTLLYIAKAWGTKDDLEDVNSFMNNYGIRVPYKIILKNNILKFVLNKISVEKYQKIKLIKLKLKNYWLKKKLKRTIYTNIISSYYLY